MSRLATIQRALDRFSEYEGEATLICGTDIFTLMHGIRITTHTVCTFECRQCPSWTSQDTSRADYSARLNIRRLDE